MIRVEDSEDKDYYKEEIEIPEEEGSRDRVGRIIIQRGSRFTNLYLVNQEN